MSFKDALFLAACAIGIIFGLVAILAKQVSMGALILAISTLVLAGAAIRSQRQPSQA